MREDGANVRITHSSRDFSYFIITAVYRRAQVDTFQVRFGPDGSGKLLWNSFVSHMPPLDTTAGTLLVASCSR